MATFRVELGANSHAVHVGAGLITRLPELLRACGFSDRAQVAIVTDETVGTIYGKAADAPFGSRAKIVSVPPGETSKSLTTVASLYQRFVHLELDRASVIVAVGGGVVGDLAGFAAATYLRGLPLVQVPTTLLAQVDSCLGGKTGINLPAGKNLVGAFYQPRLIVADIGTLATLPAREFREGLAEVIKYGAIMDAPFIEMLEREMPSILARDPALLEAIVERSLRHKAAVVASDEHEGGRRKILNFGHTVGHALEAAAGYGHYLHGEAVAIGMVAAARLSERYAGLSADQAARLERLIMTAGLPTQMPDGWPSDDFLQALRLDKKRTGDAIEFVLLDRLGHAVIGKLSFDEITAIT